MDARLYVLYLFVVSVAVFFVTATSWLWLAAGLQIIGCLWAGLPLPRLAKKLLKLTAFACFLLGTYAFAPLDPAQDQWRPLPWLPYHYNHTGVLLGAAMLLRILTVVLASELVRVLHPEAVALGLRRLGLPATLSFTIDAVLALLGGGRGSGHRRNQGHRQATDCRRDPKSGTLSALLRGDLSFLVDRLEVQLQRAQRYAASHIATAGVDNGVDPKASPALQQQARAQDAVTVAGIALTMLGLKALKLLPAIPFAPGHKLVVLTPLYIAASQLTRVRFGATLAGCTMGVVAFLLGDGRYGIFELAKHVTPGLFCDAVVPWMLRKPRRHPLVWALLGGLLAMARFGTIVLVVALAQAPTIAYAILIPGLTVHVSFGLVAGYLSALFVTKLKPLQHQLTGS